VTTADNYVVWIEQGRELAEVVDFAAVHTYPLWEGRTVDDGLDYTLENLRAVRRSNPTLPIVIAEAGWATVASEFTDRAGEPQQARYYDELMRWATAKNVTTFFFEAFDEEWKGDPADPDGAEKHWGLFTTDRRPKLAMREMYADPGR
jgi:exo-beta-1,3-glucanase (GH17 family)